MGGRSIVPSLSSEEVSQVHRDTSMKVGKDPDIRSGDHYLAIQPPRDRVGDDGMEVAEYCKKVGVFTLNWTKGAPSREMCI